MSILTEAMLRNELNNKEIKNYIVDSDTIITPSAKQYLKERRIELTIKGKEGSEEKPIIKNEYKENLSQKFIAVLGGGYFDKKPEYMTHLYGNKLVFKDHPHIILRGKLDSLQSKIMEVQVSLSKNEKKKIIKDLDEMLGLCRNIMKAEVLKEPLGEIKVLGLDEKSMRAITHNPKKNFNTGHILPSWEMGETMILLNALRSTVRETEIACITAFKSEDGVSRPDIIKAMNRLSSCVYIIMLREASGYYR